MVYPWITPTFCSDFRFPISDFCPNAMLQVRRLAVVAMNNLLAVPSLVGAGRDALAALGGPAAPRPMLLQTPADPASRERQQLDTLIGTLIAVTAKANLA